MRKLIPIIIFIAALSCEAQFTAISADFESDALGELYEGGKYNYTENFPFNPFFSAMNILVYRHGSATKYVIVEDPLEAGNQVMWINGGNNVEKDGGGGVFFMNLDLTGEGAYTSGLVNLHYSFRMMRDGFNSNSPTSWEITWVTRPETLDNGSENLDAWAWAGETVIDSFTTFGDESEWVTVSGTLLADLSMVDTTNPFANGLHVRATDGGWVGGGNGIYYIDDILVTVSQGEETPTWAGYDIVDEAGNVDTGAWLGMVNVANAPFIYSYGLDSWLYINEATIDPVNGTWVYTFK